MNTSKPWYFSRSLWGAAVSILASLANVAGVSMSEGDQQTLTNLLMQVLALMGGFVAFWGRIIATRSLRS